MYNSTCLEMWSINTCFMEIQFLYHWIINLVIQKSCNKGTEKLYEFLSLCICAWDAVVLKGFHIYIYIYIYKERDRFISICMKYMSMSICLCLWHSICLCLSISVAFKDLFYWKICGQVMILLLTDKIILSSHLNYFE